MPGGFLILLNFPYLTQQLAVRGMHKKADFPDSFPIEALRRGDKAAFNHLFTEYYPPLCFFAEKMLKDRFAAEEVVQGVMMKVWEKHADFNAFPALKSFLYISTRNAALNVLDKIRRQRKHEHAATDAAPASEEVTLSAIFKAEAMREIYNAISRLPEKYRTIIEMAYKEELKVNEIADLLSIPVNTVHKQKMRAILSLKKILSARSFHILLTALKAGA